MYLCLRIDLDYVPWDTPDARDFGHGEPAIVLRLLELATRKGYKYHFFASNRVLRAFPTLADAVLNDGHDLDWLCKHPEQFEERWAQATRLFDSLGHHPRGLALREDWPAESLGVALPKEIEFVSAPGPSVPAGPRLFRVESRSEREAIRSGQSVRGWSEGARTHLRQRASVNKGATLVVRPQDLAKVDSKLGVVSELVEFGIGLGLRVRTLRQVLDA